MLNFSKYDIFKYDKDCVLALVKQNGEWKNESSINSDSIFPMCNDWFSRSCICKAESDNKVNTALTLTNYDAMSFSFAVCFNAVRERIQRVNTTKRMLSTHSDFEQKRNEVQFSLFKQGLSDINGVINSYVTLAECDDGILFKATFKFHFKRTDRLNHQMLECDIPLDFIDKNVVLMLSFDIDNRIAMAFANGVLLKTFKMSLDIPSLAFNKPFRKSDETTHLLIGDDKDFINLSSAVIFKKKLNYSIIKSVRSAVAES